MSVGNEPVEIAPGGPRPEQETVESPLPVERMPGSTPRKVAYVALGALLLVLALNFAAGVWLAKNTPNEGYLRIRRKWAMLESLPGPVDTLILGDSSGAQGVDPEVLERAFGGKAINLCTVADMTVVNSAAMLDEYVRRYGAPKRVYVVHVYDIWDRDLSGYALAQTPLNPWNSPPALAWYPISNGVKREYFAGKYIPLFAENKSLLQSVKSALLGGGKKKGKGPRPDGFSVAEKPDLAQLEQDYKQHMQITKGKVFKMAEGNRLALRHMSDLAAQNGFELVLVNSPISERLWASRSFRNYYGQVMTEVRRELPSNVRFAFREPATFPSDVMTSVDHLTYAGAEEFTSSLAADPGGLH